MHSRFRLVESLLGGLSIALLGAASGAEPQTDHPRPNRPILVFESDDWGELSAESAATVKALGQEGYLPDTNWAKDCAETVEDLERLYRVLERHTDRRGRHPVFTAFVVVSDPDFEAIEKSGFTEYRCVPISRIFPSRYPRHGDIMAKWKDGLARRLFVPQLHAREHFNVPYWMTLLRSGDPMARAFFRHRVVPLNWGQEGLLLLGEYVDMSVVPSRPFLYPDQLARVTEAQRFFDGLLGYRSISSVAPAYRFDDTTERVLGVSGVRIICGSDRETEAIQADGEYTLGLREFGQRNLAGGVYLVRNVDLEPIGRTEFHLSEALDQVRKAFAEGEPAIVNTHRINYVSSTDPEFARQGLAMLEQFLTTVERDYPDVCYASTPELGESLLDAMRAPAVAAQSPGPPSWSAGLVSILTRDDTSGSLLAGTPIRAGALVAARPASRFARTARPRVSPPTGLKSRTTS